ncbi:hypothetical protein NZK35_20125 [Stieleria sp. ICT_E10.1]|uniref:hypothetical protein n=1 Tax=Stieleria sedimenti TaxID=2976331 RepID=UPI00217FCBF6|nr:hypothetical protein [Stieleria sedimenti]MCS7468967.1 hypothetical protein [Stieleria sedimenti]
MTLPRPILLSKTLRIAINRGSFLVGFLLLSSVFEQPKSDAGLLGGLKDLTNIASENKFTVKFEIAASDASDPKIVGFDLDYVELDIVGSKVNSTSLGPTSSGATYSYSRVDFTPTGNFANWDEDAVTQNFDALLDFESRVVFEPFGIPGASPYHMVNGSPFVFGIFTFDYSGLNIGDEVRLDIQGVLPPGETVYTNAGVVSNAPSGGTQEVNFEYGTLGDSFVVFTVPSSGGSTVIPEPGSALIFLSLTGLSLATLRRRRTHWDA